jgi:hypothetical protein
VGPALKPGSEAQLAMRVLLVHGDEMIADSNDAGGLVAACASFSKWVEQQ